MGHQFPFGIVARPGTAPLRSIGRFEKKPRTLAEVIEQERRRDARVEMIGYAVVFALVFGSIYLARMGLVQ